MTPEEKIADLKANFDYVLEGKDLEIKQLGERCNQLLKDKGDLTDKIAELEQQIVQLKKDVIENESDCANCGLRQENAELKAEADFFYSEKGEYKGAFLKQVAKTNKVNKQLAQAKQIIADLIKFQPYIDREAIFLSLGCEWKEAVCKAEQFLSDIKEIEK